MAASAFLVELKERLAQQFAGSGTRLKQPILAISESNDTFLIDSIAEQNKRFLASWPKDLSFEIQNGARHAK